MNKPYLLAFIFMIFLKIDAQEYFPNNESVTNKSKNFIVFTNAKIFVTPSKIIENGTLVIQNDKIISVGTTTAIPKNATVVNLEGKHVYASFIDIYTSFGIEKPKRMSYSADPTYDTKRVGYYWSEHIKSEINGFEVFKYDTSKAEEFIKAGFGVVGTHSQDGVARGTGCLVALNNTENKNNIIENQASNHFSFVRSATTNQAYPSSLMGSIALLKQVFLDADWYKKGGSATKDLSLESLNKNQKLPIIFSSEDKLNSIRAHKIAKEFGFNFILKGSGNEFERIAEIKNTNSKFIIPINFPEAYDVSNPYQANQMELYDLRYWNQAPTNLKVLADNNITFALTTEKLKKLEDFRSNLLKAIKFGFDKTKALESLTTIPAEILGKSNEIGSLNTNTFANFLITSGEIFDEKTIVYENWVMGNKNVVNDINQKDIRGNYDLTIGTEKYTLKIDGEATAPKSEVAGADKKKLNSKLTIANNWLSTIIKPKDSISKGFIRLAGYVENANKLSGKAILFNGNETDWTATKTSPFVVVKDTVKPTALNRIITTSYPNVAFGLNKKAEAETLLFKNATVWTNEKEGILSETDVLVKNGKIVSVGKNLSDPSAKIIDAKGKHLTAGIIDEHSHIAISSGVNEGGHNSSAEVSIQDVVDSEDIDIYRDLAGGVTISQLLHGSANPIGGQSAIVKWKWGQSADDMLYKDQPKFIKFALGENVKQSNWGINNPTRFPQTRMGVEQVFTDYFQRAKDYNDSWTTFRNGKDKTKSPRKDIEMEVLAEILNKKLSESKT